MENISSEESDDFTTGQLHLSEKVGESLAPFNPSDPKVVEVAISLLNLNDGDVVYDLGCGDGRFLISACKFHNGIKAVGVEYDQIYYSRALNAVKENDLESRIRLIHGNILEIDFYDATAIFMYLVPTGIKKIRETLIDLLRNGIRIVTYVFSIPGIRPVHEELFKGITKIYKYGPESLP